MDGNKPGEPQQLRAAGAEQQSKMNDNKLESLIKRW